MRRRRIFSKDVTEKTWQFFEKLTLISKEVNKIWCLYGQLVRGIIGIMPAFWALSRASKHGILGMTQKHNLSGPILRGKTYGAKSAKSCKEFFVVGVVTSRKEVGTTSTVALCRFGG
jgi:hypothetical protein